MKVKAFEIRDKGTFIAAIGIQMAPLYVPEVGTHTMSEREQAEAEGFLLHRTGFSLTDSPPMVLLVRMDANGQRTQASYDPFAWGIARTMTVAHQHIQDHWHELQSSAVICVEHILGERETPKVSERLDHG